jgi:hypothetical protein
MAKAVTRTVVLFRDKTDRKPVDGPATLEDIQQENLGQMSQWDARKLVEEETQKGETRNFFTIGSKEFRELSRRAKIKTKQRV